MLGKYARILRPAITVPFASYLELPASAYNCQTLVLQPRQAIQL